MKNKGMKLSCAAVLTAGVFVASGWSFFEMMVCCRKNKRQIKRKWFGLSHTKVNHPSYKFGREYEQGKEWCRQQNMKDCYITSRDGLRLHGYYLPAERPERIILLSHGYKGSGFGDFANTARFLHEHGCSLLFLDQRCCGASEGEYITFGAYEQYDVQKWAFYLSKRNKDRLPVYLYGESMGAAAVLMASGHRLPADVKGLVADCGFRSMKGQLTDMAANWFHLDWIGLLMLRLDLFCGMFAGFHMKNADTSDAMKKNKLPVLFFHGMEDTYVDPVNSMYNYSLCRSPKELVMIPGARHLCSAYADPELYRKKLLEFFEKYDKN